MAHALPGADSPGSHARDGRSVLRRVALRVRTVHERVGENHLQLGVHRRHRRRVGVAHPDLGAEVRAAGGFDGNSSAEKSCLTDPD